MNTCAKYSLVLVTPIYLMTLFRSLSVRWDWSSNLHTLCFLILIAAVLLRNKISPNLQSGAILTVSLIASAAGLASLGLLSSSPILLVGFAVLSAIFVGLYWSITFTTLATLATLLISEAFIRGHLSYTIDELSYLHSRTPWLIKAIHIAAIGLLVAYIVSWIFTSLQKTISKLRENERELAHSNNQLQKQAAQLEEQATQLEEQAETLKEERDKAQAASRAKDQFLSVVSHELRTPLNPVIGFLGLIKSENELPPESREQLEVVLQSSEHLLRMIDQVVDFSELDRGELIIKPSSFPLDQLKSELAFRLSNDAKKSQLDLQIHNKAAPGTNIEIDKSRLLQVVGEIGTNALKFTSQGSVEISIELGDTDTPETKKLRIQVSDTGIGIPQESLVSIFDPFTQAETTRTRNFGGFGLGLAFCDQVVKALGGTLFIASEVDKGTRVTIEIPVQANAAQSPAKRPKAKTKPKFSAPYEILVVEDSPTNQKVVTSLLKRMGAQTTCADNGRIALEILEQRTFDAILMDLSMPEMDGITATREIRKRDELDTIPIVALTAHSYSSAEAECMDAGMNGFLTKPVKANKLFETLARELRSAPEEAA
ncbi:response regulator [Pelagicoccus mobilis]|uniref:histidine kinase n=1 Tax=Pelagicoccus mobilis TaxID=415221 RepID=A0A934S592_9BACT|nr:response regulator [Pelagicoccus mobilis]